MNNCGWVRNGGKCILEQENKQLKDRIEGMQEERDYLFNKSSIENKYLAQENQKLKEVIDKAINDIDLVIELIKQQPTEDDSWILDRLNAFKIILRGGINESRLCS